MGSFKSEGFPRIDHRLLDTVDSEGDVLLRTGPRHLLVAAKVLVLASPVFRAMLEPGRFREGQSQPSPGKPLILELHDDNPEAMTLLCHLLHFTDMATPRDTKLLSALADVCDKYQCTSAASFHVASWMARLDPPGTDISAITDGLWVAYAFNFAAEFTQIAGMLAAALTETEARNLSFHERLPESLKGIEQERLGVDICIL